MTGTKNIVDMCATKQVKKLVYVSSTGAILEAPHGQVIREPEVFSRIRWSAIMQKPRPSPRNMCWKRCAAKIWMPPSFILPVYPDPTTAPSGHSRVL
ncbi:MAG: hypothetical protein KID09_15980 [Paenibacillus macerans]|nr:hypothetical protein [Paenibacillus macerans]